MKRAYYIEVWGGGWYCVLAQNAKAAKSHVVREEGRGHVRVVRRATLKDLHEYYENKGHHSLEEVF